MKELSEQNFSEVQNSKAALVFFYREKGCSFCDQMKPVMEQYEKDRSMIDVYWYKLGQAPDTITKDLVQKFPTIVAFKDGQMVGKLEGVQSIEALDNIDRPKPVKIEAVSYTHLTLPTNREV